MSLGMPGMVVHVFYEAEGQRCCWSSPSDDPAARAWAMVRYIENWFAAQMVDAGASFVPLFSVVYGTHEWDACRCGCCRQCATRHLFNRVLVCQHCDGSGDCPACSGDGAGEYTAPDRAAPCAECGGSGACLRCKGLGEEVVS